MPTSTPSQKNQREQAQADADETATSDTAEVTTTTVVPSTVAAEKAAEARGTEKEQESAKEDPPICVACYQGVWPADAVRASCEHGQWQRPDPAADRS